MSNSFESNIKKGMPNKKADVISRKGASFKVRNKQTKKKEEGVFDRTKHNRNKAETEGFLGAVSFDIYSASEGFGLSNEAAELSKRVYGKNELTQKKRKSFLKKLIENLGDPMIKVLLIALFINIIFLFGQSNWFESLGIAAAVLIAILVSTISEQGSEAAFKKLQDSTRNISVRVRREGKTVYIMSSELAAGDIVILGAGDRIPADGEILSGRLEVNQSSLNGESKEARKERGNGKSCGIGKRDFLNPCLLFGGTVVMGGEGIMRVTGVGDNTFYGKLAAEIQEETPVSPLKLKLTELAKKISGYGYWGAGFVAFSYMFNAIFLKNMFDWEKVLTDVTSFKTMLTYFLSAATLAVTVLVMAVPEGLPMMITVVLSSNMRRMLKDNVLVRKLNGIETAGSMNILFTDKTGTLTVGKLCAVSILTGDNNIYDVDNLSSGTKTNGFSDFDNFKGSRSESDKSIISHNTKLPAPLGDLRSIIALSLTANTGAEMIEGRAGGGNATDRALLELGKKIEREPQAVKKTGGVPFSSELKYMSTVIEYGKKRYTLIKGAPEKIIEASESYFNQIGGVAAFTLDKKAYSTQSAAEGGFRAYSVADAGYSKADIKRTVLAMSERAQRIIAVAVYPGELKANEPLHGLILAGCIGIRDQIRKEAASGIETIRKAGIQTVMITGDSVQTAKAVASEVGILKDGGLVLTSEELAKLSDEELIKKLPSLRVVARALPEDKSRLVRIAQGMNLVAGMTGDGVNDAPALKKADIGFSMGSGTEVAKEAGDIIILDDNIQSVVRAVSYGRTIFKSIRKFIIFQLTINLCAMAISMIAPLIGANMPITVIQMLWINLVIDTLAGLAFGGERARARYMTEPPKRRDDPIIDKAMRQQIIFGAVYIAIISLWFLKSRFIKNIFSQKPEEYAMTAFFTLFMFTAIFNSLNARTHELNLFSYLALNKPFILIMSAIAGVQIALVYFGGSIFRTSPLSLLHLAGIISLAFLIVPADLVRKIISKKLITVFAFKRSAA